MSGRGSINIVSLTGTFRPRPLVDVVRDHTAALLDASTTMSQQRGSNVKLRIWSCGEGMFPYPPSA